ncbi:hypothetical protein SpCBS45565_g01228 [Spizellomyces sp. 'palustris']|nr:hypothetical protein SpCBS45565_g01228 [Spizellomyces sp. 'palustris']
MPPERSPVSFICVHAGAGYHHPRTHTALLTLVSEACLNGMHNLLSGTTSCSAATTATNHLESSPLTNAGPGSNLTIQGTVECDASVMCGRTGAFGGVGAVSGIRNPICGAVAVMRGDMQGPGLCGLVPPVLLVGEGAKTFCAAQGVEIVQMRSMITDESQKRWERHMRYLREAEQQERERPKKRQREEHREKISELPEQSFPDTHLNDTVGCVTQDPTGNITSTVSSGGISLKHPGRVGEAAIYGAGTWSECTPTASIGCSVSGTGEQIIKTLFARECAKRCLKSDDVAESLRTVVREFLDIEVIKGKERNVGVIIYRREVIADESVGDDVDGKKYIREVWWAHTTKSFCVAWMSSADKKPHARMSTLAPGHVMVIEGRPI